VAKKPPFAEEFFLAIATSQFGAPTLGVLSVLSIPAAAGIALGLLGWDAKKDKAIGGKTRLTELQKFLVIATFPNPFLPKLWLNEQEEQQLAVEMKEAAFAPIELLLAPFTFWAKKAGL